MSAIKGGKISKKPKSVRVVLETWKKLRILSIQREETLEAAADYVINKYFDAKRIPSSQWEKLAKLAEEKKISIEQAAQLVIDHYFNNNMPLEGARAVGTVTKVRRAIDAKPVMEHATNGVAAKDYMAISVRANVASDIEVVVSKAIYNQLKDLITIGQNLIIDGSIRGFLVARDIKTNKEGE